MRWWRRRPSPKAAEKTKVEIAAVKGRLSRVESRMNLLRAQVNVLRRDAAAEE